MSNVVLLAHTTLTDDAYDVLGYGDGANGAFEEHADHLAELAGRECYQSFDRPNPATESNADYLANIIRQRHTSVLAHASFTFRFTDVSRSLTHELIRHRFLAFSELSQRYVDMENVRFVVPPAMLRWTKSLAEQADPNHGYSDDELEQFAREAMEESYFPDVRDDYASLVDDLREDLNLTRKQAREAARAILPNCTETKIVVSGNVRAWRDFIAQRNTPGADAEIREVAGKVLAIIARYAPNSVADLVSDADPGLPFNEVFDNVPTEGQVLEDA